MIATILDTVTGKTKTKRGPSSWNWMEGDYSCDCNRNLWSDDDLYVCPGCERYLVVQALFEGDEEVYSLDDLNSDYPQELKDKYLPQYEFPSLPSDAIRIVSYPEGTKIILKGEEGWTDN